MRLVCFIAALGVQISAVVLSGHDVGLSTVRAKLEQEEISLTVSFAPGDVRSMLPTSARLPGKSTPQTFTEAQPVLEELATMLWEIRADGKVLAPLDVETKWLPEDALVFQYRYIRPQAKHLSFRSVNLGALPSVHRQYFTLEDERGSRLLTKVLSAKDELAEVDIATTSENKIGPEPSESRSFLSFLRLGIQHIWTGYDHLLFLFGLLVVCRSFKSLVSIVSCFTLAHSLTLALATLNLVTISSRFVEPMIAASIVFVGLENLFRNGREPVGRWALTFVFGLIHGFGFASALRELGVGTNGSGIVIPLVSFNVGVELGQIAVAALVLPLVWWLRQNKVFLARGVPALSSLVAAAGFYWLLQRTF
jgi:hydrogenase/urease accessory protein HupE